MENNFIKLIVERLVCILMSHERNTGKKIMTMGIVEHAFDLIHQLIDAVVNSGSCRDILRMNRLGFNRGETLDISSLQRINQALSSLCTGIIYSYLKKLDKRVFADELINASKVGFF